MSIIKNKSRPLLVVTATFGDGMYLCFYVETVRRSPPVPFSPYIIAFKWLLAQFATYTRNAQSFKQKVCQMHKSCHTLLKKMSNVPACLLNTILSTIDRKAMFFASPEMSGALRTAITSLTCGANDSASTTGAASFAFSAFSLAMVSSTDALISLYSALENAPSNRADFARF